VVEQSELLKHAVDVLERLEISYAIVGSFASSVWGESRFTQDIDILIRLPANLVKALCDAFPPTDFYVSEPAAHEAVSRYGQFNVIHPASGNKIDFMIAGESDWTTSQLARHKIVQFFPGQNAAVAAPEDVIIGKLIYFHEGGSDKHLRDIIGILEFSGDLVDRDYIADFAEQLGVSDVWQAVQARLKSQWNS
jgi:hypothetical protein